MQVLVRYNRVYKWLELGQKKTMTNLQVTLQNGFIQNPILWQWWQKIYYEFDIHSLAQDKRLQWDTDVKQGIIIGIL